jgi:hypothetical protein
MILLCRGNSEQEISSARKYNEKLGTERRRVVWVVG